MLNIRLQRCSETPAGFSAFAVGTETETEADADVEMKLKLELTLKSDQTRSDQIRPDPTQLTQS